VLNKETFDMRRNKQRIFTILGLIFVGMWILSGCVGSGSEELPPTNEIPVRSEKLSEEEIIALVKEDLSSLKGVDVDEIGTPNIEKMIWGDTSLGCPEEGMGYAEVETPGYQILLAIGGPASIEQFDYRTDMTGNFVLCE
jgi:hypothetical protein